MDYQNTFGERIRDIRKSKHMTINQVAGTTGLTASFISQFERGLTRGSVASISKIAQALGTSLADLADGESSVPVPANTPVVIRKDQRRKIVYPDLPNTVDYLLTGRGGQLEVIYSTVEPGGTSGEVYSHDGDEECVIVLEGTFLVAVQGEEYTLHAGDTITYCSRLPHSWKNIGKTDANIIWVITPPTF